MHTLKSNWWRLAAVLIVALVAGSCGGDSVEELSKEDYITQGNAICTASNDAIEASLETFFESFFADQPEGPPDTPEEAQIFAEAIQVVIDAEVVPRFEEQITDLRALAAPQGDADVLAALYNDWDSAVDEFVAILDDAVAGDEDALESVVVGSTESVLSDVYQRANDYGLTLCGQ